MANKKSISKFFLYSLNSHSLCLECKEELYGEMEWYKKAKAKRAEEKLKKDKTT